MDGNFGLVRKRSSGTSYELPKHRERVFIDDDKVSSFVDGCSATGKADDAVCYCRVVVSQRFEDLLLIDSFTPAITTIIYRYYIIFLSGVQ
jgi:hypothetical protein